MFALVSTNIYIYLPFYLTISIYLSLGCGDAMFALVSTHIILLGSAATIIAVIQEKHNLI